MSAGQIVVLAVLGALLAKIAITDIRYGLIRNTDNIALAALAVIYRYFADENLLQGAIGGILGGTVLVAGNLLYHRYRGRDGFGYGDVKFMLGAGIWTGPEGLAPLLLIASMSGLAGFAVLHGRQHGVGLTAALRFGPYLSLGLLVVLLLQWTGLAPWQAA